MRNNRIAIGLLFVSVVAFVPAHAARVLREDAPHQHGVGKLQIVLDRDDLHITLETTTADIVGFEHAPRNAKEGEALEKALATLRDAPRVFALSKKAGCALREAKAERGPETAAYAGEKVHSDIRTNYRYACKNVESLRAIDLKLFSLFPKIRRVRVELKGRDTEVVTQATRKRTRIPL